MIPVGDGLNVSKAGAAMRALRLVTCPAMECFGGMTEVLALRTDDARAPLIGAVELGMAFKPVQQIRGKDVGLHDVHLAFDRGLISP